MVMPKHWDKREAAEEYAELIIGGASEGTLCQWLHDDGWIDPKEQDEILVQAHLIADEKRGVVPWD